MTKRDIEHEYCSFISNVQDFSYKCPVITETDNTTNYVR